MRALRLITILVLALAPLLVGVAFAQDPTPAPADFLQDVLLPALLTLASAAVAYLASAAAGWIRRAAAGQQNELVKKILELVANTAATAVASIAQTAINDLKRAREDGRLTREEAAAALKLASEQVWAAIGQAARDALLAAVGGSAATAIDKYIKPAVEAEVLALEALGATPAEPITDPADREKVVRLARSRLALQ